MTEDSPLSGLTSFTDAPVIRIRALAPFSVRSFRFQWPADLTTAWAFEMENIILSWYILVETGSVLLLAAYGALQFIGTLLSPLFGVMGDRFGARNVLCIMRSFYTLRAIAMMTFALTGSLDPVKVFILAGLMGLVRPSDNAMRHALIAHNLPGRMMISGMSLARTTMDSSKIVGALTGAAVAAVFGIGTSYAFVSVCYAVSLVFTIAIGSSVVVTSASSLPPASPSHHTAEKPTRRASPWRDIVDSMIYVWNNKPVLAAIAVAFLANATAWPMMNGLMPYVARDIYHIDRIGLGYLMACMGGGALIGSMVLSRGLGAMSPGRVMIISGVVWHLILLAFAYNTDPYFGMVLIFAAGYTQSYCSVPIISVLARLTDASFRGRVMGLRMLVVYALPLSLLSSGPLIEWFGFAFAMTPYFFIGIVGMVWIGWYWRTDLWDPAAPANAR
jgi:MFS family permease